MFTIHTSALSINPLAVFILFIKFIRLGMSETPVQIHMTSSGTLNTPLPKVWTDVATRPQVPVTVQSELLANPLEVILGKLHCTGCRVEMRRL